MSGEMKSSESAGTSEKDIVSSSKTGVPSSCRSTLTLGPYMVGKAPQRTPSAIFRSSSSCNKVQVIICELCSRTTSFPRYVAIMDVVVSMLPKSTPSRDGVTEGLKPSCHSATSRHCRGRSFSSPKQALRTRRRDRNCSPGSRPSRRANDATRHQIGANG